MHEFLHITGIFLTFEQAAITPRTHDFVHKKFSKSQEILRNISKIVKLLDRYYVYITFKVL